MLTIERSYLDYYSHDLGMKARHYVLIADYKTKKMLLSYPNLFLYNHTRASKPTSSRYSNIISMFYRFLSTLNEFKDIDPGYYHALASNKHIKMWQVHRQVERINAQKTYPSSETIFEDAKILLIFFRWIITSGYVTSVNVALKTWVANFRSSHMLNYLNRKAKTTIDSKNIKVLEKERRQKRSVSLITKGEIKSYLQSFHDPVYAAMFKFALGTAMRPMELCKFPYIGNGLNTHILPFSDMNTQNPTIDYTIIAGKGNKNRAIVINSGDLKELELGYIIPYYKERAKKYKERYGKPCPPSILFLTKSGEPVDAARVANRGSAAKVKAMEMNPDFRESVVFYSSRKWWPTMFLIKFFKEDLLTEKASSLYAAAAEVLVNQMGHEDIDTTYSHYVDDARLVMMAHHGRVNELITAPDESVSEFIDRVDTPSL